MLNDSFHTMDRTSKENRMRNIITSKARGISAENVNKILSAIDIEKQYTITGSTYFDTLLRNAYEEYRDGKYEVTMEIIYGTLDPGLVKEGKIEEEPVAEDMPAAFIKNVKIYLNSNSFCQYSVFIYQKRIPPDSPYCCCHPH